jgi:hypothetical protein
VDGGVHADHAAEHGVADHDRRVECGFVDRVADQFDDPVRRVRWLVRGVAVPGRVEDQHLPVGVDAGQVVEGRLPDPAGEGQPA